MSVNADSCLHCGLCTKGCAFLQKYGLDLAGFAQRPELAYHCFLCGDCRRACPVGIDGRAIAMSMRRQRAGGAGGRVPERGYGALVAEKRSYLFRNTRRGRCSSVLFPGCNFLSFFPKTTDRLIRLLSEADGTGVWFDCCGKPISDLGLTAGEQRGAAALNKRLKEAGVRELTVLCPNCYYHLRPRVDLPVVSIYQKLSQLGLGSPIADPGARVFVPCPDRDSKELAGHLAPFFAGGWTPVEGVQCCGLGGCAAAQEPELSAGFCRTLAQMSLPRVYVYCATCAGRLRRGGVQNVVHALAAILESDEEPVIGPQSLWHRAKRIF